MVEITRKTSTQSLIFGRGDFALIAPKFRIAECRRPFDTSKMLG